MNVNLEEIWQDYGLDKVQENIDKLFPEYTLSLGEIMGMLVRGELLETIEYIFTGTVGVVLQQMTGFRDILLRL